VTTFHGRGTTVGTPAIDSNLLRNVYVTFDAVGGNGNTSGAQVQNNLPAGSVVLGVTVEPLLSWLWIGGLLVGLGAGVSFLRRRYADDATSVDASSVEALPLEDPSSPAPLATTRSVETV
jgi:cytochrome c biogenesis factor